MKPYIKIKDDGDKFYYKDKDMQILHREDGAAIECPDGTKEWYLNGELHREDGPAVEWANGPKFWYLNDKEYTEAEFNRITKADKDATIASLKEQLAAALKQIHQLQNK